MSENINLEQGYRRDQSVTMKERQSDMEKQKEERRLNFLTPYFARAMLDDLVHETPLDLEHITDEYYNIEGPGYCTSFWCGKDYDFFGKHLREAPECLKEAEQIYTGKYAYDAQTRIIKQISDNYYDTFSESESELEIDNTSHTEDFDYFTMQGLLSSENILRLRGGDEVLNCVVCEDELDHHYRCHKPNCIRVLRNMFNVRVADDEKAITTICVHNNKCPNP